MLDVSGLRVRYGQREVLHGVDLSVAAGQIAALVGANGAGKSTTLAGICGLVAPCAGSVVFAGKEVAGRSPEELTTRGIALVPEGRRVFATLSIAENLRLGGASRPADQRAAREAELLTRFPVLRERYRQKAGSLSGGEQQMLAIARALMSQPKLLLLDEPSLGLAPLMIDRIFDLIAALKDEGLAILLVEQNVTLALEIADHATVLADGAVALRGNAQQLASSDLVRQAYLGGDVRGDARC